MPKIVDEAQRRQMIAEAVWKIAAERGLDGATVRAIAAECGLSVGAIQHSFASQEELKRFAMELIVARVTERVQRMADAPPGEVAADSAARRRAVAALLLETLPLDAEREQEARVWAAFSAAALHEPSLAPYSQEIDRMLETLCAACLTELGVSAEDVPLQATHLHALLDGLTMGLLNDPTDQRRKRAVRVIEVHLGI